MCPLTDLEKKVIKCWKEKMSYSDIARKFSLKNYYGVKKIILKYKSISNTSRKNAVYTSKIKNKAIKLYLAGFNHTEITKILKIKSLYTVKEWIKVYRFKAYDNMIYMDKKEFESYLDEKSNKLDFEKIPKGKLKDVLEELEFQKNCNDAIKKELGLDN
jgi:hypothetical protein